MVVPDFYTHTGVRQNDVVYYHQKTTLFRLKGYSEIRDRAHKKKHCTTVHARGTVLGFLHMRFRNILVLDNWGATGTGHPSQRVRASERAPRHIKKILQSKDTCVGERNGSFQIFFRTRKYPGTCQFPHRVPLADFLLCTSSD